MADKDSKEVKEGGRCKPQRKFKPQEIRSDLKGYEMVKDVSTLRKLDRVKYLRKDTGAYHKGGLVVTGDKNKGYIVIQSFVRNYKTCQPIKFSLKLDDVVLFRKV